MIKAPCYVATLMSLLLSLPLTAHEVEFLHWWTSKGEKASLSVLQQQLDQHQIHLKPSAVVGGGGDSAMTVLQARALAGNTPSFAQIEGPSIQSWDAIGILHPLNQIAQQHHWEQSLYPLTAQINKTQNGYVALPLTLHRLNWLWVNQRLLQQLELNTPKTWPDLFHAMEKAKQHQINPLAVGEQAWQVAQLFESLVIASGGVDFYRTALVELNVNNIDSAQMRHALAQLRRLSDLAQPLPKELPLSTIQNWEHATLQLIEDKALFQIGGDWILGELLAHNVSIPTHINCVAAPQSHRAFVYNMDSLIFMASKQFERPLATQVANALADKQFQLRFNQAKGSIPVHKDIAISDFSRCQQQSYRDFQYAMEHGLAVPTMIDSMAVNPVAQQAINAEIYRFYRNSSITSSQVIRKIIAIASSQK